MGGGSGSGGSQHQLYDKMPPLPSVTATSTGSLAEQTMPPPAPRLHSIPSSASRKGFKSFRNASCDVAAFGADGKSALFFPMIEPRNIYLPGRLFVAALMSSHRRPSGAKLHSLAVEAPMTKVINIILAAQENSPLYIAQALDKVRC